MRRLPLSAQIAAGMAVGLVVGPLLGARAAPLGELGRLVIQLIKAAATPLLFLAIVNAILKAEVRGRQGLVMLGFALLTVDWIMGRARSVTNALADMVLSLLIDSRARAGQRPAPRDVAP